MSKWCNRRSSEEALSVLKEWFELHNKPLKVRDGTKFISNKFRNFLNLNGIKDKQILRRASDAVHRFVTYVWKHQQLTIRFFILTLKNE
ncbi:MAG: hypothetical protein WAM14_03270 [Candidatus Nitrosopolaris sp.]